MFSSWKGLWLTKCIARITTKTTTAGERRWDGVPVGMWEKLSGAGIQRNTLQHEAALQTHTNKTQIHTHKQTNLSTLEISSEFEAHRCTTSSEPGLPSEINNVLSWARSWPWLWVWPWPCSWPWGWRGLSLPSVTDSAGNFTSPGALRRNLKCTHRVRVRVGSVKVLGYATANYKMVKTKPTLNTPVCTKTHLYKLLLWIPAKRSAPTQTQDSCSPVLAQTHLQVKCFHLSAVTDR